MGVWGEDSGGSVNHGKWWEAADEVLLSGPWLISCCASWFPNRSKVGYPNGTKPLLVYFPYTNLESQTRSLVGDKKQKQKPEIVNIWQIWLRNLEWYIHDT